MTRTALATYHVGNDPFWSRLLSKWIEFATNSLHGLLPIVVCTDIPRDELSVSDKYSQFVHVINPSSYAPSLKLGYHDGINKPRFELVCFERWFVLRDICRELGFETVIHVDNDLLLTQPIDHIGEVELNSAFNTVYSIEKTATFLSTWNIHALSSFSENIHEYFSWCRCEKPARSSDMQYMAWLINRGAVLYQNFPGSSDEVDYISNFRRYLLRKVPPQLLLPDCDIPVDHNGLGGVQLAQGWSAEYLAEFLGQYIHYEGHAKSPCFRFSFIHFQGIAKAFYSSRENDLYSWLFNSLFSGCASGLSSAE